MTLKLRHPIIGFIAVQVIEIINLYLISTLSPRIWATIDELAQLVKLFFIMLFVYVAIRDIIRLIYKGIKKIIQSKKDK